ncbi:uncharacterized protein N7482_009936 [Penicillium canariense]|uniref:Uncharacterized protein n=1 Tax=Penicillium canariense TaxID=189055 RepID=A0A9W9LGB9_9EURO|nr:uncharacterized protein N7482_009936 [Penicillium canariense]KAJ5153458.1 hypothetical protein N7482_009936 [Penicillium canariense]
MASLTTYTPKEPCPIWTAIWPTGSQNFKYSQRSEDLDRYRPSLLVSALAPSVWNPLDPAAIGPQITAPSTPLFCPFPQLARFQNASQRADSVTPKYGVYTHRVSRPQRLSYSAPQPACRPSISGPLLLPPSRSIPRPTPPANATTTEARVDDSNRTKPRPRLNV